MTYKTGEKSKALCWVCDSLQVTTFINRPFPLESSVVILVSVCDSCDNVVGIPHQSIHILNKQQRDANLSMGILLAALAAILAVVLTGMYFSITSM